MEYLTRTCVYLFIYLVIVNSAKSFLGFQVHELHNIFYNKFQLTKICVEMGMVSMYAEKYITKQIIIRKKVLIALVIFNETINFFLAKSIGFSIRHLFLILKIHE